MDVITNGLFIITLALTYIGFGMLLDCMLEFDEDIDMMIWPVVVVIKVIKRIVKLIFE